MLLGIDVSHWQGAVDWARARAAGVAFGFAKATEGTGYRDPRFTGNVAGMRAAGVVPGAYHFLTAGHPADQADAFCRVAPADVIHALDVEGASLDVATWVDRYRQHYPTKTLVIYTGRDLWARAGGGRGASYGPLWAAGYRANAYLPAGPLSTLASRTGLYRGSTPFGGWAKPMVLQPTDKATVAGVAGPCDADLFFGTLADLQALALPEGDDDMPLTADDLKAVQAATKAAVLDVLMNSQIIQNRDANNEPTTSVFTPAQVLAGLDQKIDYYLAPRLVAIAAQVDALAAQVAGMGAGTPPGVTAAFAAGVAQLQAELGRLRVTVATDAS